MPPFPILPFLGFCLVASATPGPNNMINLTQGLRVGMRRALPFALGAALGVGVMLALAQIGLGAVFAQLPALRLAMRALTTLFLLYLAWKIATAGPIDAAGTERLVGFGGGFAFQWVNPKTWAAVLAMATIYLPARPDAGSAVLAGTLFAAVGLTTQPLWIGFGRLLRRHLAVPARAHAFNIVAAVLLLASTLPVILG